MSARRWQVTFRVYRQKGSDKPYFENFKLEVDPDEYVLDAIERIWAFKDRSLVFRHACHHSTCGACGMRVNGAEKLTCITPIYEVTRDGGMVKVEPLRNFPVVSDLVVDMSVFYQRMDQVHAPGVMPTRDLPLADDITPLWKRDQAERDAVRLIDCIECGMCISACPVPLTTPAYLGPAVLAAVQTQGLKNDLSLVELADSGEGVWRCHSAFECSAVCPSFVEPAWRIMDLRRQLIARRIQRLFFPTREEQS